MYSVVVVTIINYVCRHRTEASHTAGDVVLKQFSFLSRPQTLETLIVRRSEAFYYCSLNNIATKDRVIHTHSLVRTVSSTATNKG